MKGAHTPEELETLFEDAFVVRDPDVLARLFEERAVLVPGARARAASGEDIARAAAAMWDEDFTYVAEPRRVLQAGDTALVLADSGVNVMRRGTDGKWRYAILLLDRHDKTNREDQ